MTREELTPRELTIMRELLKDGSSNYVIADRLRISPCTVKAHMRNILAKLNAKNRAHLIILWKEI